MAVEFGVLLPTREAVMSGRPETAPLLAMADRAEAAGFDSGWIGDSVTARPRHEPLTLLAAVAGRTRRARLGTAVLLPALREAARFNAWFPLGPTVDFFAEHWPRAQAAVRGAGRAPDDVPAAAYVTVALDPRPAAAEQRLHAFLETYYAAPARAMITRQATYAGPIEGCVEWLQRWVDAGARHIVFRFAGGDQLAQVDEAAAQLLPRLRR
jgi:alkanesulfonate monooxygenase SsuD/methylene tetrahydromethanopterin reductase-like flavin-dependent oxidoreductase (luciferase family)